MKKIPVLIALAVLVLGISLLLAQGGVFSQGALHDPWMPQSGGTMGGNLLINGKLTVTDSIRVAKTSNFIGAMTATKITASDSIKAATVTSSGNAYFGSSTKFVKFSASGYYIGYDADTVYNRVSADTFYLNTQIAGAISTKNVRLDGLLYLPNKVTADSISVTTLIANVWDTVTIASRFIDTAEVHWGVGTATATKTIDTVIVAGISGTSIVLITPKAAYTVPLYVSTIVADTFFVKGAEADTAIFTSAGYFYEVKD